MTLPASGTISFYDINIELGRSGTATIGLDNAENGDYGPINRCGGSYPFSTNPAAINEWYNYNHNAASTLFGTFDVSGTSCAAACALPQDCSNVIYTVSGVYYSTNICTAGVSDGYYALCDRSNCYYFSGGNLISTTACTTTTTTTTTTTSACSCDANTCSSTCDNAFCFCYDVTDCTSPSSCI